MSRRSTAAVWAWGGLLAALAVGAAGCQSDELSGGAADTGDPGSPDAGAIDAGEGPGDASPSDGSDELPACIPVPACDAPPPDPGPAREWRHTTSSIAAAAGSPNHRGRDLFFNPGDPQWIIGKFSYGLVDKDIKGEDVDVHLLRDCGTVWERLGTTQTTEDGQHATVEHVEDTGGRVYFEIPASQALGVGRHRVHLVVGGDLSSTELFIEVVPKEMPMFVTDVDGTLTTFETEEFTDLLTGDIPDANEHAAEALTLLASKGYRPIFLTARPEFLVGRTREFHATHGFPPGIIHTNQNLTGAVGGAAAEFKAAELLALDEKGLHPTFAFGNTASDAEAYGGLPRMISGARRILFQFTDTSFGGRRIESYADVLAEIGELPAACR